VHNEGRLVEMKGHECGKEARRKGVAARVPRIGLVARVVSESGRTTQRPVLLKPYTARTRRTPAELHPDHINQGSLHLVSRPAASPPGESGAVPSVSPGHLAASLLIRGGAVSV
jgi:hypothetical protein